MNPTQREADEAQRRLNEIADTIDLNYHLVQLSPQVAQDIRVLTARRLMLEQRDERVAPSYLSKATRTYPEPTDEAREAQAAYDDHWGL